jgi:chemotaxis protein methyltransferase CheR
MEAVLNEEREFVFTHADFERIRKLIHEKAGISLSPSKQEMVYSRLARRLRARGLTQFGEYLGLLESGDAEEWQPFVNALTTNLTAFFREPHHFETLKKHAMDRSLRRSTPYTVWCCAASTGEEPYSIAMTLANAFGSAGSLPPSIVASDVDTNVLTHAAAGIYPQERLSKLGAEDLRRSFLKGAGAHAGYARVRPELRQLITFRRVNLLDGTWPVRGPFDAIFCRNVMIYFDKPTQRRILERLAPLLREDGLLFAGHSESFLHSADLFRLRGNTVYELAEPHAARRAART